MLILKLFRIIKEQSLLFALKKIVIWFTRIFSLNLFVKIKAFFYFKSFNLILGKNVKILGLSNRIEIGENNSFYSNTIFEFGATSKFKTGNKVILSYGVLISCMESIEIGNFVQIGEYTSIRDTTHDYKGDKSTPIMDTPDISKSIIIGNNVWIGRGCLICEGTIIEDGVVVGANSIVKGTLTKDSIYAGVPIRKIKNRIEF